MEAFQLSKADACGRLPQPDTAGNNDLAPAYDEMAGKDAARQLSRAGIRLAGVLNVALDASP